MEHIFVGALAGLAWAGVFKKGVSSPAWWVAMLGSAFVWMLINA